MHKQETRIKTYTLSLGCAKNRVDTESMLAGLGELYQPVDHPQEAEVLLVNTCAFIQPAVEESVEQILSLAQDTQDLDPRPLLVVTGCLPARYGKELEKELPEVDLWLGFAEQGSWLQRLCGLLPKQALDEVQDQAGASSCQPGRVLSTPPGYAYLKLSEGCHRKCSFCLIPSLRGSLVSRPQADLLQEAELILAQGVSELCLVAQDLTAYGRDLGQSQGLQDLLGSLTAFSNLHWLRLLYLYPTGLSRDFLFLLRSLSPPFLPYFDLPLQHVQPHLLRKMGRPFTRDPREVLEMIKEVFPEASLRTSLIVGFPGETEADFLQLKDFVQEACFDHLGVFAFYPENGVQAAELSGQVSEQEKQARKQELLRLQRQISRSKLSAQVGQELQVMVDAPHQEWPTLYQGRAWFQAPEADGITYVSGYGLQPGQLVQAQIVESKDYDLVALA
jgi:tRNA-2-methylthio-N6-dimethylallyladenosine synthase/ribosomal protein S12 methylthiotransferase